MYYDSFKVKSLIISWWSWKFPVCVCVCVCLCLWRQVSHHAYQFTVKRHSWVHTHTHAHSGPFKRQMCCNVMLSVINIVVCLTAPTEQGSKNYTHTDIRVYVLLFFFFFFWGGEVNNKTKASFSEKLDIVQFNKIATHHHLISNVLVLEKWNRQTRIKKNMCSLLSFLFLVSSFFKDHVTIPEKDNFL